jgi:restriction system protein
LVSFPADCVSKHSDPWRLNEQARTAKPPTTPYETSGVQRFDKIVRFSTISSRHAGWLAKNKGIWSVTEAGKNAMKAYPDPEDFYQEAERLYKSWRQGTTEAEKDESLKDEVTETPVANASVTFEEAEEQAWNEIEKYIHVMRPYEL